MGTVIQLSCLVLIACGNGGFAQFCIEGPLTEFDTGVEAAVDSVKYHNILFMVFKSFLFKNCYFFGCFWF